MLGSLETVDTVAFLSTSKNRVRLLETIDDGPRTRCELQEVSDIARATLGRILADFERRGLVTRDERRYTTTARGSYLVYEFRSMLNTVEALEELDDLVEWLPGSQLGFDPAYVRDARITRPTQTDSIAPVQRSMQVVAEAGDMYGLTNVFAHGVLKTNHEAVCERGQQFEVVFTCDVLDVVVEDETSTRLLCDLIERDGVTVHCYDGPLPYPYNVWLIDGCAVMGVINEDGLPRALIETEDQGACDWVRTTIDYYQRAAMRVGVSDLAST